MKTKAAVSKKAATKRVITKSLANKASTKNVPLRKAAPEKKAFVKVKTKSKANAVNNKIGIPNIPDHIIPKAKGKQMIDNYAAIMGDLEGAIFSPGIEFHKSIFEKLLLLSGIESIRVYNAINDAGEHTFVLTAIDKDRNDIYFNNAFPNILKSSRSVQALVVNTEGVGNMGTLCPAYDPTIKSLV
jgi:hypothetical protein